MLLLGIRAQCIQFRNEDLLLQTGQTGRKYVHICDFMCLGFMVSWATVCRIIFFRITPYLKLYNPNLNLFLCVTFQHILPRIIANR